MQKCYSYFSSAKAINRHRQVAGYSLTTNDAATHAFIWTSDGGMQDLGTLGGSVSFAQRSIIPARMRHDHFVPQLAQ